MRTCFILWQCNAYMFCIVTVLCVHVLYCDSVMRTCFILWQCYAYMFCIVAVVRKKKMWNVLIYSIARSTKYSDKARTCWKSICYFESYLQDAIPSTDRWQHEEKYIARNFLWTPRSSATTKLCFPKFGGYTMCTTSVSIKIICILTTKHIYGFRMALKISSYLIYKY